MISAAAQGSDFRFSTIYGDHMVLQQAPNQANVWGYTSDCQDKVSVNFDNKDYTATVVNGKATKNVSLKSSCNAQIFII